MPVKFKFKNITFPRNYVVYLILKKYLSYIIIIIQNIYTYVTAFHSFENDDLIFRY